MKRIGACLTLYGGRSMMNKERRETARNEGRKEGRSESIRKEERITKGWKKAKGGSNPDRAPTVARRRRRRRVTDDTLLGFPRVSLAPPPRIFSPFSHPSLAPHSPLPPSDPILPSPRTSLPPACYTAPRPYEFVGTLYSAAGSAPYTVVDIW